MTGRAVLAEKTRLRTALVAARKAIPAEERAARAAALAADHEVVELAYDWRRPVEDGAARLAAVLKDALDRRAENGAAVRVVAHSSGGLLVRAMQWVSAATWRRFAARTAA